MRLYLDTSAFVKRYSEEEGSETISQFFEGVHEIVTSRWTLAETIAAIDKKVSKRQITTEERDMAISVVFSDIADKNITFVKLSEEFVSPIIGKILAHHISADDALQLFSCIVSLSPIFLACDKVLIKAAKKEGLQAFNVEKSTDKEKLRNIIQ